MTTVNTGSGNDTINTGSGNDNISTGAGNDTINSGAGNDNIDAGSGNDFIDAGSGNDIVDAGSGNDTVLAGTGNDIVDAGSGNDIVDGGDGDDRIDGESGDDILFGGAGNDIISGGSGVDAIYGGSGNDTIGSAGNRCGDSNEGGGDTIFGDGRESYNSAALALMLGNDLIYAGSGDDRIYGDNGTNLFGAGAGGNDRIFAGSGRDTVYGEGGNDEIDGEQGDDILDGGGGNDEIDGGEGKDAVFGGAGNNVISGGDGKDTLYGGSGDDTIGVNDSSRHGDAFENGKDTIYGDGRETYANSTLAAAPGNDTIRSGRGNDLIYGDNGNNTDGSAAGGNDSIYAGSGNDLVYGEGGNDELFGEKGNDTLSGGAGNDRIVGGLGADTQKGGSGNDVFAFSAAANGNGTDGDDCGHHGGDHHGQSNWSDSNALAMDLIVDFQGINDLGSAADLDKIDLTQLLGAADLQWGNNTPTAHGAWFTVSGGNTYVWADINGSPGTAELAIKIAGVHNLVAGDFLGVSIPVSATADTNAGDPVVEAGVATAGDASAMGNVLANDSGSGTVAVANPGSYTGTYGTLVLNANGSWAYTLNDADGDTNALKQGQVANEVFSYTASNGSSSATSTLTIAITGTNDLPVAQAAVAAVAEDASITGSVVATDADAGETATLTYALVGAAPAGLTFSPDGSYTFDASSYDSLPNGQQLVLTIPFAASDALSTSASANLVITITGTNDVPVAQATVAAVAEDASINGSVVATDADTGETTTLTYALVNAAPIGLTFNPDGTYTFDASSYDSLPNGQQLVLTLPFTASDAQSTSASANLVITITGTNDVPVAQAAVAAVAEDAMVSGSVGATDADSGETATLTYALVNAAPTGLTFNADGSYTFDASSYDSLPNGQQLVLTVPFAASDALSTSASANLVITITGTNDVPVAQAAVAAVAEDAMVSGSVVASDADTGETAMLTYALVNAAPTGLTFNTNGTYTFDASSYDSLPNGQQLVLTVPFTASDALSTSASANLVITITGTNDVPVAQAAVAAVAEDAMVSGSVVATDADAGETATLTYALVNAAPTGLTFNINGTYTFDASSYDSLTDGQQLVLTIPFTASDAQSTSASANLVITITGTNDVPVAQAAVAAVAEDATVSGSVSATDADAGETATLTYALVSAAPVGLTFNPDGSYSFDASSYDSLPNGQQLVLTIPFTASDAQSTSASANLVITVTGTNDLPVAQAAVAAVAEDASINGSVVATDADAGETATLTYSLVSAAPTGLTFNPDGSYTFDASSYDSLPDGQQLVLTVPFTASDALSTSAGANLVITITGTNDVPVAQAAVAAVAEDAMVSGSVSATDADTGETAALTYALVSAAPIGLTFNPDGTYSFDATSYDSLPDGQQLVLTVPFTASDALSTSASANLMITITGTNDVPVAQAAVAAVAEDAMVSGSVGATDADAGETATLTYALVNAAPTGLTFNADGSYTFDASSYDSLPDGQQLVLTVPFTASDAQSILGQR